METSQLWMMNAIVGRAGELVGTVITVGLVVVGFIVITHLVMPRTPSGLRLYSKKHVERSVEEINRVIMHPEDYESQEEIVKRKERSRVIADQIIPGKTRLPEEEFKALFDSAFGRLRGVDLDFATPTDFLSPTMVLHCLISDLWIGVEPKNEHTAAVEVTAADEQRIASLECI